LVVVLMANRVHGRNVMDKCSTPNCDNEAAFAYHWPDIELESFVCHEHVGELCRWAAQTLGHPIPLRVLLPSPPGPTRGNPNFMRSVAEFWDRVNKETTMNENLLSEAIEEVPSGSSPRVVKTLITAATLARFYTIKELRTLRKRAKKAIKELKRVKKGV
jgi:hypothetical protein